MPWDPGDLDLLVLLVVFLVGFGAIVAVFLGSCLWRENGRLSRQRRRSSS